MRFFKTFDGTAFPVHTLANGLSVAVTSPHGYKFSDGTELVLPESIDDKYVTALTVEDIDENVFLGKVPAVHTRKRLPESAINHLRSLMGEPTIDIILVPFVVIAALYDMEREGMLTRGDWSKVVAYNATPETRRSRPDEKIVDTRRWSY